MSVQTMLRKEKDGTLYKNTKLSSALEDVREKTKKTFDKATHDNRVSRALDDIKTITTTLQHKMGVQPAPKTDIKARWARLLERRGDLKEKYAGKYGKNSAGFDLQGKTEVQEIPVAIENRKGSVREGTNPDGTEWRTKFKTPYGYIEGSKGADGDEIDVYVGPNKNAPNAFVVRQKKSDGKHDEDTVMLGYPSKGSAKKDILRHYEDKSQVGEVVGPMPVEMLKAHLARADGKKITKLGTVLNYRDGDPPHMTGLPAKLKRRKGDVPTRMEDPYPPAVAENRQENQQAKLVDGFASAGGDDVSKVAEALSVDRALGDERKFGEGPTRGSVGAHPEDVHRLRSSRGAESVLLADISSSVGQDESKTASPAMEVLKAGIKKQIKGKTHGETKEAMLDELKALGALTPGQLEKLANVVTTDEAKHSLRRLKKLEDSAPSVGEIARGGGVGAVVMPISALAWRAVAGPKGRVAGPKGPQQIWPGGRPMAATAAQGAVLGGLLPAGRHKLEQEVEKQKLKEYVGQSQRGTFRGKVRKTLGV